MTKIIDLRPDKNLINSKFEKYQFCADTIDNQCEKKLKAETLHLDLNSSQDSWLEARLFAFHNHLYKNSYDSTCWFIDSNGGLWQFKTNESSLELFHSSKIIGAKSPKCVYNPSVGFGAKNIVVLSDGGGLLELLIETDGCVKAASFSNIDPAIILDAKFVDKTSDIVVCLCRIEEGEEKKFSRLIFLRYHYDSSMEDISEAIKLVQKQTLKVKGSIEHVYIEGNGKYCHIISQDHVEFDYDSKNPIKNEDETLTHKSQIKIPRYCWSQDENFVTVYLKVPEKYAKVEAQVEVSPFNISISVGDIVLLNGEAPNCLEPKFTTWKKNNDTLEIELFKSEVGLMWNELLKGDTGGEYLPNEALAAEIHSKLLHLCSEQQETAFQGQPSIGFNSEQLEECDINGEENILQRINLDTHSTTHMAMLGSSNQVLFAERNFSGHSVCLRHDHDGCVWKLEDSENDDVWNLEHTDTFPGFGYIEAGKTNKQFCVSPLDRRFIVIVEHTRHAFLYEKPVSNAHIGKQRVLDLGSQTSTVLGAAAIKTNLIILTKSVLYQLNISL